MLEHLAGLDCLVCGESFRPSLRSLCPQCKEGGLLRFRYALGRLEGEALRRDWSRREPWLWRFRELLPLDEITRPPPLQVGHTPLYGSAQLASRVGVQGLLLKDESRQPTGRIADRAAALLVAVGAEHEQGMVSGPLSSCVAPFAASAQARLLALVRDGAPLAPLAAFGARVVALGETLDGEEALRLAHRAGWFLADRPNPLAFEGLKTLGLELGEQLAERMPDWVVLDGSEPDLVEAVREGLAQLAGLGLFRQGPKLLSVNGPGGEAEVQVSEAEAAEMARAVPEALGIWVEGQGSVGLAGLRRAVEQGKVPGQAVALVVLQGAPGWNNATTLPPEEVVRNFEGLSSALGRR